MKIALEWAPHICAHKRIYGDKFKGSPLRQRMIDDMWMRKLASMTQSNYLRAVRRFSVFLGHSPDHAALEDLRRYQLHLVDQGISAISLNAAIVGLKFFFDVKLDHPQLMRKMQLVRFRALRASSGESDS